ncbi:hypothetical protein DFJ43DRAFT_1098518 [Lentinula guzmanii]|uniref:OTU domain-containing protein n=1 Tax=Lentinula guzmanii TaxID=2804957 RepID=A0AA38MRD0_9AGAR|nr:hypothetical protein DFJ43DRAFT_1098518 [Lentinula guzmanii]
MGSTKKQNKSYRTRATRSSGRSNLLTSDPLQNTVQLNNQLRSLGLYAAPTIGDGNCLFRALSDQYYGSPSRYGEVRREICDFIEAHPEQYEGFVDVDEFGDSSVRKGKGSGLSVYVAGMRQNATYGGHMELSAFAHLVKRNIKVVQPGLVYVIQWDPSQPKSPKSSSKKAGDSPARYTRSSSSRELDGDGDALITPGEDQDSTIYVAYHDWEHFSSVRNLRGPHTGIPRVYETVPPPTAGSSSSASPPPEEHLPPSKARKKERERKEREKKDAGRLKAREKTSFKSASNSFDKPKSKLKDNQDAVFSSQQTIGFKLKIPPRSVPTPPALYMTAATPISAGVSPLSSLPPSPTEELDGLLDAATIPLPTSAPPSVATSPPVSHSPSPAPATSSEQPSSDSEDAVMESPSVDLSATMTLPKLTQFTTAEDSAHPVNTYSSTFDLGVPSTHLHNFASYPYAHASYPAHLAQVTPTATTASYSYRSSAGSSSVSPSASTSNLTYQSSQASTTLQTTSESSLGSSTASPKTPICLPSNSSAVAIDPLSNLSHLTHLVPPPRIQRSPKRSFEESVGEEGSAESAISNSTVDSKRSRIGDVSSGATEPRGRQGHRSQQAEDSPEPAETGALPSLKDDEPESADSDDGHHTGEEALQNGLPDARSTSGLSTRSESPEESNDDDDEYVDEEETKNDEDEDEDEDGLEPSLKYVQSVVPPKVARNRYAGAYSERPLTRRQRKKLGLPKARNVSVSGKGIGKIIIPGGKSIKQSRDASSAAEWTANGNGRVDVRGFRELKI